MFNQPIHIKDKYKSLDEFTQKKLKLFDYFELLEKHFGIMDEDLYFELDYLLHQEAYNKKTDTL